MQHIFTTYDWLTANNTFVLKKEESSFKLSADYCVLQANETQNISLHP